MKRNKLLEIFILAGICVGVAVQYGVKYGWLAGQTRWLVERMRMKGKLTEGR